MEEMSDNDEIEGIEFILGDDYQINKLRGYSEFINRTC